MPYVRFFGGFMRFKVIMLVAATFSINNFAIAKEPQVPTTGFAGCATKVLAKYPGFLLSVEAEGNNKGEFFYEFDVFMKDRSNPRNSKEIEVECNPKTVELTDAEEEVNITDERFKKLSKISKNQAEKIASGNIAGKIVDREYAIEDGKPVYEFDIYNGKTKKEIEIEIDGITGKVLEKEFEYFEVGVDS